MERLVFVILALVLFGLAGRPAPAEAQALDAAPAVRTAGTVANLFETLDPATPIDGVRLQLPAHWTVRDLRLLRYGTVSVPVQWEARADGTLLVTAEKSVQGPHELVVQVGVGEESDTYEWKLTPFIRTARDSLDRRRFRRAESVARLVTVNGGPRPAGSNQALDLGQAQRPILVRSSEELTVGRGSFTIEFWMRSIGLDEVILSTWTGEENAAYPAEFVVDQSGRLRFYFGRASEHQALRSTAPVADDQWHHVGAVYDESEGRLRLLLDGAEVDSLRARDLPRVTGTWPVAIGGRRPQRADGASSQRLYTGLLDEVRFWPRARAVSSLRRQRARPFSAQVTTDGPLRFSFNDESARDRAQWPAGARRVPTALSFRSPLRNLRAHTQGQSVTLRWEAEAADEGTFVVERSPDGERFTAIARLDAGDPTVGASESREIVYTDDNVPDEVVYYRIRQVGPRQESERTTGTVKIGLGEVSEDTKLVELVGNFPNPFEKRTTIAYRVDEPRALTLTVWDLSGKQVTTLADGMHDAGYYEEAFGARDLPSGTYFARLESNEGVESHRMVLLK